MFFKSIIQNKKEFCPNYIGCFADVVGSSTRDLDAKNNLGGPSIKTIEECVSFCIGNMYASMQNGYEFFVNNLFWKSRG